MWTALVDEDVSNQVGPLATVVETGVARVGHARDGVLPDEWRPLADQQVVIELSLCHGHAVRFSLKHEPDERLGMHVIAVTGSDARPTEILSGWR